MPGRFESYCPREQFEPSGQYEVTGWDKIILAMVIFLTLSTLLLVVL